MKYLLQVCKWFDEVNGNTYHNVLIKVPDGRILRSGFQYGYGSQYIVSALDTLKENGIEATRQDLEVEYETQTPLESKCRDFRGVLIV